ncbi:MAG: hypothetical protein ACU85U_10220 [Gammaproteobacteria bacterium]|jgi:hypothetical protein
MNLPVRSITRARVQSDLAALNAIGRDPDSDILLRTAGSDAEIAALEWLRRRVDAAQIDTVVDEQGFVAPGRDGAAAPVVIAGELVAAAGAGPFDGALAIVAGLEVLRCLPAPVTGVVLATGSSLIERAGCVFRCAALRGAMLSDSGRQVGVALSDPPPFTMRWVCEIGEAAGIGVLPMPLAATGIPASDGPSCVLVVDAALNRWPPDAAGWAAVTACADLLLNLVANVTVN